MKKKLKARSEKGNCETEPSSRDKEAISPRKPELFKCTIADWKGKKAQISFVKEKKVR